MRFVRFFWIFIALAYLPQRAFSQVTIKTILEPDNKTYKVYLISLQSYTGIASFIGSSQVTLVVPHGSGSSYFQLGNISSTIPNMRWNFSGRTDSPPENPDYDYLFFSFINNTLPIVKFDITANQEILLFTFQRTSQCGGRVYSFNNQTDPFVFPNSMGINTGNNFTIFGAGGDAYRGNHKDQPLVGLSVNDSSPCAGEEVTFMASPTIAGTYRYQWFVNDVSQGSPSNISVFKYKTPLSDNDSEATITVKLLDSGSDPCDTYSTRKSIKIDIKSTPDAKIAFDGFDCMILPTKLSVTNYPATNYQWQENGVDLTNENKNELEVVKSGKYSVKIDKSGCLATSAVQKVLGVLESEKITLQSVQDTTILSGGAIKLNINTRNANYFSWTPANSLSNATIQQPIARPLETTVYTITASNELGCPVTASLTVNVRPALYIPNAFSPNNDSLNDEWKIENIGVYPDATVEVFNTWGNTVFFSKGYSEAWDGKGIESSTYSYLIITKYKTYQGFVTVLR